MTDAVCMACGRGIGWGDRPCLCKKALIPRHAVDDRDFFMALDTRPDNCTCDYPAYGNPPQHRFDCSVYGANDRPNFGPRKGAQTGMSKDELLAELMSPQRTSE